MKRLFAIACSVLMLFGCSQSSPSADSAPEAVKVDSSAESKEDESYKDIALGGYTAKIPSDWIIEDNYIYFNDRQDFPVAMSLLLTDYDNLDDLFSDEGSKEEFITGNGEEIFDFSPACSEMEEKTYGDIPALSFNMTGIQDGQSVYYIYNLFDNPGGGVLIVTMCTDSDDISSAIHDYLNIFYNMEPSEDVGSVSDQEPRPSSSGSLRSYSELQNEYDFSRIGNVNNDKTGKWRLYECVTSADIEEYIYDFCESCVVSDDELYFIVNFGLGVTYRIDPMGSIVLVDTHEYVDGEEHDASTLAGGMSLADTRMFDLSTRTETE